MIAVVCTDNKGGMLFNHRRVSRDREVIADILTLTVGKIRMCDYSATLFDEYKDRIEVSEDFLKNAGDDDCCFVENVHLCPYADKLKGLVIYKWNRDYPSDFHLDVDTGKFRLIESKDFAGYSHDKITREVYRK